MYTTYRTKHRNIRDMPEMRPNHKEHIHQVLDPHQEVHRTPQLDKHQQQVSHILNRSYFAHICMFGIELSDMLEQILEIV